MSMVALCRMVLIGKYKVFVYSGCSRKEVFGILYSREKVNYSFGVIADN